MEDLKDIVDSHRGEAFLVCGTGASIDQFSKYFYESWPGITIGVNGITDLFTPDFHIDIHARPGVIKGRDFDIAFDFYSPSIRVDIRKSGLLSIAGSVALTAFTSAYQLGAGSIYLIGIDFQGDHFKACRSDPPDTRRPDNKLTHFIKNEDELKRTIRAFKDAFKIYRAAGVKLFNYSQTSLLGLENE